MPICIYTLLSTVHTTHTSYIEMLKISISISNKQVPKKKKNTERFSLSGLPFRPRCGPSTGVQESPLEIYRCNSYCPGGVPGSCDAGRIGVTCGDCPQWEFVQNDAWCLKQTVFFWKPQQSFGIIMNLQIWELKKKRVFFLILRGEWIFLSWRVFSSSQSKASCGFPRWFWQWCQEVWGTRSTRLGEFRRLWGRFCRVGYVPKISKMQRWRANAVYDMYSNALQWWFISKGHLFKYGKFCQTWNHLTVGETGFIILYQSFCVSVYILPFTIISCKQAVKPELHLIIPNSNECPYWLTPPFNQIIGSTVMVSRLRHGHLPRKSVNHAAQCIRCLDQSRQDD